MLRMGISSCLKYHLYQCFFSRTALSKPSREFRAENHCYFFLVAAICSETSCFNRQLELQSREAEY